MSRKKKAQSMLEYVLLITVVALVLIYAANSIIKKQAQSMVDTAGNLTNTSISKFSSVTR